MDSHRGYKICYNRGMKNTHLEHLEDNILNGSPKETIDFLKSFGHMLTGKKSNLTISTKWDGSPAIICGIDPQTDRFFVGTKSVFNKFNPKVCYTETDIDLYYFAPDDEQLANKLKVCLKYLPTLGIRGMVQGDLLFTNDTQYANLDGERYITFTPNAITYAVPVDSLKGISITEAELGIVFHTVYLGDTIQTSTAGLNAKLKIPSTKECYVADANFVDESGITKFNVRDSAKYTALINRASGSIHKSKEFLKLIHDYGTSKFLMATLFKQFFNERIRTGQGIVDTQRVAGDFALFYARKMDIEILSKKTETTKKKYEYMKKMGLKFIEKYQLEIYFVVASYISVRSAKKMVLSQLNKVDRIKTFVNKIPSQPEGYVVSYKGTNLKFVDDDFRQANITVVKSWTK